MGIRTLAALTLSRAIEDICPDFSAYEPEHRAEKIKERVEKYREIESEFDTEWEAMEEAAQSELDFLLAERDLIFGKIRKRKNTETINKKIEAKERKREQKIARLIAKGAEEDEIEEVRAEFEEQIAELREKDNSKRIEERLAHSERVWNAKLTKLKNRFRIKETGYNIRRNQRDRVRMSLQWFLEDFDQVLKFCRLSGLDVKGCYSLVRERLTCMGRESPELDELVERVNRHEY